MNTDTEYLKSLAEEKALKVPTVPKEELPDHRIVVEAKRLEKAVTTELRAIDNFTQRDTFYYDTLYKIVDICDTLFGVHNDLSPDTEVVMNLLTAVKDIVPNEIRPNLKLAKAFVFLQQSTVTESRDHYAELFRGHAIDPKLIEIAILPFERFITGKEKLCWGDHTWLKGYQSKLDAIDWEAADCNSKTEALMSLLIGRDLNHDRFFIYCKKYMLARVAATSTKNRRLQEYSICEKLVLQDTQTGLPSFDHHANPISARLLKWIKEESDSLKAAEFFDEEFYKIEFNWDVDTIALFWKYLMEYGVTKTVPVDLYAKQIAASCSSKGKAEFKWETMKGRFYGKNPKYLKKIYDPLTRIIEDVRRFLR